MKEWDGFQDPVDKIVPFLTHQGDPIVPEFVLRQVVAENRRQAVSRKENYRYGEYQLHVNVDSHQSINRILNKI